ncbi:MAG TPA: pentapeptide repeat-containing protein [Ktedonobacteraceae bacterium]|nr:pentapeptide repeat-containing protein [Ktedonobacteraceae bacterium]
MAENPNQKMQPWQVAALAIGALLSIGLLVVATIWLFLQQHYFFACAFLLITLLGLAALIYAGYSYAPFAWTGFGIYPGPEDRDHQPKSLWDWLTLLIIPIVLAAGAIGISTIQSYNSDQLNHTQFMQNQQLAQEQQVEANLQTYLDRMSDLLLDPNLHTQGTLGDNVRILATARTLTILQDLDGPHKATVLKFLYSGDLIAQQDPKELNIPKPIINPVVNLNSADFSYVDLTGFQLSGADLAGVNFSNATLNEADLSSAYLDIANLSNAHLKNANLCFASITGHAKLRGADLSGALLGGTNLTSADLTGTILTNANLGSNDPVCHALQKPNVSLPGATLTNAILISADLTNADLTGAIVTNANFTKAIWKHTTCTNGMKSDTYTPDSCVSH